MLTQDKLQGLAFPLIKVRFINAGENSRGGIMNARGEAAKQYARWTASYDGRRITRPYDDSIGSGAKNAMLVARELWKRIIHSNHMHQTLKDYIFIPVNIDDTTYGFVPVERYIINNGN